MHTDPDCIFCKIVAGQIPSKKVYEDDQLLAFHDIAPWAPVHLLIIPKQHLVSHYDVSAEHEARAARAEIFRACFTRDSSCCVVCRVQSLLA